MQEVMLVLEVFAYGYSVNVRINDKDMQVKGGSSKSLRLFLENDPVGKEMPANMKYILCLKKGKNKIDIDYKKTDADETNKLSIKLSSMEQFQKGTHTYLLESDKDAEKLTAYFEI